MRNRRERRAALAERMARPTRIGEKQDRAEIFHYILAVTTADGHTAQAERDCCTFHLKLLKAERKADPPTTVVVKNKFLTPPPACVFCVREREAVSDHGSLNDYASCDSEHLDGLIKYYDEHAFTLSKVLSAGGVLEDFFNCRWARRAAAEAKGIVMEERAAAALSRTWDAIASDALAAAGVRTMNRADVIEITLDADRPLSYGNDDEAVKWFMELPRKARQAVLQLAFETELYGY